ncbi:BufA2 family periplasmic bufferin-type metallophore [Pseudomonas frederiksbergensis]|uniref:BufA2 family periplasmic bufferin-type metallophore n=1 Tax=Pseudomonas frederiksbergensis TaxID=104087 RepID=UPI003D1E2DB9
MNFKSATAGAALAFAAATMFAGVATQVQAADAAKVHCYGVTSCKGMNDCKTAENACKGQAVCKGHGFKSMTQAECTKEGGKVGE